MSRHGSELRRVGQEMLAHFIDPGALELRLWARSGWRQKIQPNDRVEIWHGMKLVGQLTGDAIHSLVTHHLAGAALGAHLLDQMATLRTPRTIDPDAGGGIPIPVEPPMLPPPTRRKLARDRYQAKAGVRVVCGAPLAGREDGRCTLTVPCRWHPAT
jgi:hypothetical protein